MYGIDKYDDFGLELCAEVGNVGILQNAGLLLLARSTDWRHLGVSSLLHLRSTRVGMYQCMGRERNRRLEAWKA